MHTFDALLTERAVRAVYQPIVDLTTGVVVGYEALARGPEGTAWERPDVLFAAARDSGRLAELDWTCRAAAYRGALEAGLAPDLSLFVNTEPEALGTPCPADLRADVGRAEGRLRVISEMTERSLTADPRALLEAVERARSVGWGVAMDDVGVDPASLAMLPFVHPDVIKLDMSLVQRPTDDAVSSVALAVRAQAERTGAQILAEGIETEQHRRRALGLGATLGQGWLFGRPGPLPRTARSARVIPLLTPPAPPTDTPCALAARHHPLGRATKGLLLPVSKHLERRAQADLDPPVVLSTFQRARHFTPLTAGRYFRLARRSALVSALGTDMGPEPIAGVRGGDLSADDPLALEWNVVVIGPYFASALLACEEAPPESASVPDSERVFRYLVTHDRDLVVQAARALLCRIVRSPSALVRA